MREDTGADLVERARGERPAVVCDPTMLLAAEDERYAGLADIVEANRGLWCPEAERYLLEHWKQQ